MAAAEWSAAIEQVRAKAEHDIDLYFRVLTQYEGPEGWAQLSRGGFYMTKQELLEFYKEYIALQWKHGHAAHDAAEGARPVALRFFAVPDGTILDENSGQLRCRRTTAAYQPHADEAVDHDGDGGPGGGHPDAGQGGDERCTAVAPGRTNRKLSRSSQHFSQAG